jgi:hypothetical protein
MCVAQVNRSGRWEDGGDSDTESIPANSSKHRKAQMASLSRAKTAVQNAQYATTTEDKLQYLAEAVKELFDLVKDHDDEIDSLKRDSR